MSVIRFGEFELDEQTLELRRNGIPAHIQQQPARVLAFLLNHRGSLVTREQIRLAIWGEDTFVDFEQGLNFCIRQIRLSLKDRADSPYHIETLPRLGYRYIGSIEKHGDGKTVAAQKRLRIAILPFEDLSGRSEDYFAAGLTEDMISAFSRIEPDRLRVIACPSSERGADTSAEQLEHLRRQLDLDYLFRGTVRRSGDRIRINAQVYDLREKSILWTEACDSESADLLAIQEEVAGRLSRSLALEIFPSSTVGARRYARSAAAYDAYLKGRFFWHKMTAEAIRRAMDYFNEALSLDSGFAPAYAGLADCYAQMGSIRVGLMKPLEAVAKSRSYLQKALELDQTLAEAHCTLGLLKSWYDWDWNGADREFQAALALDPSQVTAMIWQSLLFSSIGRHKDSIASMERAREIEPLSPNVNLYLGVAQTHAGQHDLAIRQIQQSIELDPGYYRPYFFLGRCLSCVGRHDEAVAALQTAISLAPENIDTIASLATALAGKGDRQGALGMLEKVRAAEVRTEPAILIAETYARLGMTDEMFACLERAVAGKSTPIYIAAISSEFAAYSSDPRYRSFLASIGLRYRASA